LNWKVIEMHSAIKELSKVPRKIQDLYRVLVGDLEKEGPYPHGWDSAPLQGRSGTRIKLTREYRVIIEVREPNLIIIKVAHRKEAYE